MTYVLALDCSMNGCGVGVYNAANPALSKSLVILMAQGQADRLVPMVQEVLQGTGITLHDISLIVATHGPGSFTGLRIGLSAARSFGLALDLPLKTVGTLDVLARACAERLEIPAQSRLVVITDTKRTDYYLGIYDSDATPVLSPQALSMADVLHHIDPARDIVIGDAAERFAAEIDAQSLTIWRGFEQPDPLIIAAIGVEMYQRDPVSSKGDPLYLRDADVSMPKTPPRRISD